MSCDELRHSETVSIDLWHQLCWMQTIEIDNKEQHPVLSMFLSVMLSGIVSRLGTGAKGDRSVRAQE
jgi:hypothetical protein